MRVYRFALLVGGLTAATHAVADTYALDWSGNVTIVEGDAPGANIVVDDPITAHFVFDTDAANGPAVLPLGGGTYSVYGATLTDYRLTVGSYRVVLSLASATLTYIDDSFGADELVWGVHTDVAGPFDSAFANVQFQASGPTTVMGPGGLANGLPYAQLTPSFFDAFGGPSGTKRVFGALAVRVTYLPAVPEPATWTAMVLGFGAIGAAMRRRSRVARGLTLMRQRLAIEDR